MLDEWNTKANYLFLLPNGHDFCFAMVAQDGKLRLGNVQYITVTYPERKNTGFSLASPLPWDEACAMAAAEVEKDSGAVGYVVGKISRYLPEGAEEPVFVSILKRRAK